MAPSRTKASNSVWGRDVDRNPVIDKMGGTAVEGETFVLVRIRRGKGGVAPGDSERI